MTEKKPHVLIVEDERVDEEDDDKEGTIHGL